MHTDKHRWKKRLQKEIKGLVIVLSAYVGIFLLNSFLGGYWLVPERDGRDKYSFGLSITAAILWQPRFGHESLGHWDYPGAVFLPLIRLDRKFIHPTLYMSDESFDQKFSVLKASQIHPHWRDTFQSKVVVTAICDETNKVIQCIFRYTGSDNPREIIEIKMTRVMADSLAVSSPTGFAEKLYEGRSEFFKTNYVYWHGKPPLTKDQDVILQFPAKQPKASTGRSVFYYERAGNTVDPTSICSVEIK